PGAAAAATGTALPRAAGAARRRSPPGGGREASVTVPHGGTRTHRPFPHCFGLPRRKPDRPRGAAAPSPERRPAPASEIELIAHRDLAIAVGGPVNEADRRERHVVAGDRETVRRGHVEDASARGRRGVLVHVEADMPVRPLHRTHIM